MKILLVLSIVVVLGGTSCATNRKAQKSIPADVFAEMQSAKGHKWRNSSSPIKSFDAKAAAELKAKPEKRVYMLYAYEGDSYPRSQVYHFQKLLGNAGVKPYFISNNHDWSIVPIVDSIAKGTTIYMADGNAWRYEMRPKRKAITEALLGSPRPTGYKPEFFIEYLAVDEQNRLVYLGTDVNAPALQTFLK